MDFATNLKFYRKKAGYSQKKLAELCGIAAAQISHFENGLHPNLNTLEILCSAFGITATEMLGW
jgi:transcriptional regulator with XRE-family HTH domain